ncbi:MAG: transporter, partial [Caloramator sp.]|nr:transporter [Caloramator sp.]
IVIMASIAFLVALFSTNGVITINSFIVPLSTSIILILGAFVFVENKFNIIIPYFNNKIIYGSALLYACFNFMTAVGVLSPMASEIKNKNSFIKGCILGSVVLTLLEIIINYNILAYYPASFSSEVPNLYIAKNHGPLLPLYLTIIIWFEMFTTEVGCLYSLSRRMQIFFNKSYFVCLILILLISIPFSFIGFSNLIKLFYPPFGLLSFLILLIGAIKYIILRK